MGAEKVIVHKLDHPQRTWSTRGEEKAYSFREELVPGRGRHGTSSNTGDKTDKAKWTRYP